LTASTFRMADLKLFPHSLYRVLPPHHLVTHGRWLRLLVASALRVLTATPGQPPRNVLFLLDEFAVLGHLRNTHRLAHRTRYVTTSNLLRSPDARSRLAARRWVRQRGGITSALATAIEMPPARRGIENDGDAASFVTR
jgi:hypothetical protein